MKILNLLIVLCIIMLNVCIAIVMITTIRLIRHFKDKDNKKTNELRATLETAFIAIGAEILMAIVLFVARSAF